MALKGDRLVRDTDISYFMSEVAAKGSLVMLSGAGSGASMDDPNNCCMISKTAYGSGEYPLGILLCDVVNLDLTRQHLNQHKDEVQFGGKVTIMRRGWCLTNMIEGTPAAKQAAYSSAAASDGKLCGIAITATTPVSNFLVGSGTQAAFATGNWTPANNPAFTRVGTWLTSVDADGYAKLDVNLV